MESKELRSLDTSQGESAQTVREIMRGRPKTLPVTASVGDLRRFFADPHVVTALIVNGDGALAGVVERAEVAGSSLPDGAPIDGLVRREFDFVDVRAPVSDLWKHEDLTRIGRLAVLEADGKTLAGLVCARPNGAGFCR